MKRIGGLWEHTVSCANLHEAVRRAALGKKRRPDVAAFLMNQKDEISRLRRELIAGGALSRSGGASRLDAGPGADFRATVFTGLVCLPGGFWLAAILTGLLARRIKCAPTLNLATKILAGSVHGSAPPPDITYFPGDDLFSPPARPRGLPLGNQTSQFFANLYLDPLDQYLRLGLRVACYVSGRRRLVRGNVVRFRRRMKSMQGQYAAGKIAWQDVQARVAAWIGHAMHGDTWKLREEVFRQFPFRAGRAAGLARGSIN